MKIHLMQFFRKIFIKKFACYKFNAYLCTAFERTGKEVWVSG